jgi:hypothetical protein
MSLKEKNRFEVGHSLDRLFLLPTARAPRRAGAVCAAFGKSRYDGFSQVTGGGNDN